MYVPKQVTVLTFLALLMLSVAPIVAETSTEIAAQTAVYFVPSDSDGVRKFVFGLLQPNFLQVVFVKIVSSSHTIFFLLSIAF